MFIYIFFIYRVISTNLRAQIPSGINVDKGMVLVKEICHEDIFFSKSASNALRM